MVTIEKIRELNKRLAKEGNNSAKATAFIERASTENDSSVKSELAITATNNDEKAIDAVSEYIGNLWKTLTPEEKNEIDRFIWLPKGGSLSDEIEKLSGNSTDITKVQDIKLDNVMVKTLYIFP